MSELEGQWPPDWEDQDGDDLAAELPSDERPDTGHLDQDVLAEHLAEVSSVLASVPMPTLPDAFALRIGAAIAAEAATRTPSTAAAGGSATARSREAGARRAARLRGTSRASGPGDSRPPGKWRKRLVSPAVMAPLLICLVLGGFGYLFTRIGGTSSSSSIASSAAGTASSPFNRTAGGSVAPHGASLPAAVAPEKGANALSGQQQGFAVTETGTRYAAATLATQVHDQLALAQGASTPSAGPSAAASASASSASSASSTGVAVASKALMGCVDRLTGDARPSLVDRATYAGKPAYIIAVPSRVWVVGLGCTAANTELVTTTALTGLSGNLRALGSV
jgi:hypothetical protein